MQSEKTIKDGKTTGSDSFIYSHHLTIKSVWQKNGLFWVVFTCFWLSANEKRARAHYDSPDMRERSHTSYENMNGLSLLAERTAKRRSIGAGSIFIFS